ncbi:hypothetical protein TI05_03175 [Achromatium sp. WMS3]|nr:hypothetical protein TI05_03175 [Achromatium sp. WMS3]
MIIQGLTAENFLKYRRLKLNNLPTHGIIAISGSNESGKSSIGEAICFALFGRTFAVKPNETRKLIRWGENRCAVILEFNLKDDICYQLSRSLDRDNNHTARLYRTNDPDNPIARGIIPVNTALEGLLGYNFGAFIDSFYLAQREITAPKPQGNAIHIMAGIAPLIKCRQELQAELEQNKLTQKELTIRIADTDKQVANLAFNEQQTHILTTDQNDLANREKNFKDNKQYLKDIATDYQQRITKQQRDKTNKHWMIRLQLVALLLAIISFGTWFALSFYPKQPIIANIITNIIANIVPIEIIVLTQWLLYSSLVNILIIILIWIYIFVLNRRKKALRDAGNQLADILAVLDELDIGLPKNLQLNPDKIRPPKKTLAIKAHALQQRLLKAQITVPEIEDIVTKKTKWLDQVLQRIAWHQTELHQKLLHESEQRQINDRLASLNTALQTEERELQERIQVLIQAEELLQGAMRHLSHKFNHHLRGLASRTLPMFTEDRYQHLQIDEDLTIRAFSNEKRDFMEFDEVSSGTQRQMMLALRLSLSQKLIDRVVCENQFIFLDEPFAFFDAARTRSALTALPRLSKDIIQIWVVAQQFPEDFEFAHTIQCHPDCTEYSNETTSQLRAL